MLFENLFDDSETLVSFDAGRTIFKEGERGDLMYVLIAGEAEVFVDDQFVGLIKPSEIFGEFAVFDAGPRSTTVVARTDCTLRSINQRQFTRLVEQEQEFAASIARRLAERIRWLNKTANEPMDAAAKTRPEDQIQKLPSTLQPAPNEIHPTTEALESLRPCERDLARLGLRSVPLHRHARPPATRACNRGLAHRRPHGAFGGRA